VINALKHAFPNQRKGKITVDYHAKGKDWTLQVADDGIGMPTNADDAKPGLGTGIVEALSNQLRAGITVVRDTLLRSGIDAKQASTVPLHAPL
jgi:two-component system, sensor histidine kinase PdtaS